MKAAVFSSNAEKCGPGRCMEAAILSRRFRVTRGDDTLMVADGLGRSLMEEDWPDNTDEADRSISHPTAHPEPPPNPCLPSPPPQNQRLYQPCAATVSSFRRRSRSWFISQRRSHQCCMMFFKRPFGNPVIGISGEKAACWSAHQLQSVKKTIFFH